MTHSVFLQAIDFESDDASHTFTHSLHETGFAVLKNHPISGSQVDTIYQQWQDFFEHEAKYEYRYHSQRFDGFFPAEVSETAKGCSTKDLKEYFHYYHPWGQCPVALRTELVAYHQMASALATTLLTWVEQHSPPEVSAHYSEPLSGMINESDQTLLRILHYPPLEQDIPAGAMRAAAHEDINLLTILPAASEPGLQVKSKTGEWLDVPCDFGMLIVNTGDMLQEASNGYFPSTTHRVINPPKEFCRQSRISLPLFLHPRPEVILSSRYTARTYLQERLRELGFADA